MTGSLLTIDRPSSGVLVTPGGVPIAPASVTRRLAAISPRLSIAWMTGAHRPYWALFARWPDGDPRWEQVRQGQYPAALARDIEQMFPEDCGTEDMVAYVEQRWGDRARASNASSDADRIVTDSLVAQAAVREGLIEETLDRAAQHFADESEHLRNVRAGAESAHPMVSGGLRL